MNLERFKRIREEFKDINENIISGYSSVTVGLMNDYDLNEWKVSIFGPKDTSYKGGLFILSIKFPDNYPNEHPEVCFLTPIYHVNVNPKAPKTSGDGVESLGQAYLSTLNLWKPEYRMREVLTNIYALFYMANPDSPYEPEIAEEFRENRDIYEEKIKQFTQIYANPMKNKKEYPRDVDWNFNIYLKLQRY